MVVNHNLSVLRRSNLRPCGVVAGRSLGVDVDDLAVSLVLEQQPRFPVGDDLFLVHTANIIFNNLIQVSN